VQMVSFFGDVFCLVFVIYLCTDLLKGTVSSSGFTLNYGIICREIFGKNVCGDLELKFSHYTDIFLEGIRKISK
jgi:hypothetical protein